MKRSIALLLVLSIVFAFAGCTTGGKNNEADVKSEGVMPHVMTHEEFVAAELQSQVVIETYVQAKQGWWEGKATLYTQDKDGAYFVYEMPCTEEEYNKLTAGTKIKVTGYKTEWSGEVEIIDATFEIMEGNYVAPVVDMTEKLGAEDLIKHQNEHVAFKGLTVQKIEYKNNKPGDDIYLTLGLGDASYNFCVEVDLTGTDSDVYKTVNELKEGDVVDVECFLYWYEGANPHITSISLAK